MCKSFTKEIIYHLCSKYDFHSTTLHSWRYCSCADRLLSRERKIFDCTKKKDGRRAARKMVRKRVEKNLSFFAPSQLRSLVFNWKTQVLWSLTVSSCVIQTNSFNIRGSVYLKLVITLIYLQKSRPTRPSSAPIKRLPVNSESTAERPKSPRRKPRAVSATVQVCGVTELKNKRERTGTPRYIFSFSNLLPDHGVI